MGGSYSSSSPKNSPRANKKQKNNTVNNNLRSTGDFTSGYIPSFHKADVNNNNNNVLEDAERLKVIFWHFEKLKRVLEMECKIEDNHSEYKM